MTMGSGWERKGLSLKILARRGAASVACRLQYKAVSQNFRIRFRSGFRLPRSDGVFLFAKLVNEDRVCSLRIGEALAWATACEM